MTVQTVANAATAAAATTTTTTSAGASTAQINGNTFLQLLMTQLQNQNPLDPMNPTEFTQQLVSYSALEQQIESNTKLDSLTTKLSALSAQSSISYLGTTAELNSNIGALQSGQANWSYDLPSDARSVQLTVTDANGATVYSGAGDTGAGAHALALSSAALSKSVADGSPLTLTVSALDSSGTALNATVHSFAVIDGLQSTSDGMTYDGGGLSFADSDIVALHRTN